MWICSKLGFFSVVQKAPDEFHVRARCRKDLVNLQMAIADASGPDPARQSSMAAQAFAGDKYPKIVRTNKADYRFRIVVTQSQWMAVAYELFQSVDYANFKGVIGLTRDQSDKLPAYTAFHHDMERWQNGPEAKPLDWEPSRTLSERERELQDLSEEVNRI